MRRALLIEIRRSSLRWWLPLITGFQLVMLFFRSQQWEFAWSEASAVIGVATGISVPLLAAAAAWEGTRWHRSGDLSVLHHHARFAGAGYAVHLLSILILATIPYLITVATAWIVTASVSGAGMLWPSYLLLALAVQWGAAGFGYAAGRLFATRLVVPAVVLILLVPLILLPGGHPFALFSISGPSGMVLLPQAVVGRVVIAAAVLAIGLAIVDRHGDVWVKRWRRVARIRRRGTPQESLRCVPGPTWRSASGPSKRGSFPNSPTTRSGWNRCRRSQTYRTVTSKPISTRPAAGRRSHCSRPPGRGCESAGSPSGSMPTTTRPNAARMLNSTSTRGPHNPTN